MLCDKIEKTELPLFLLAVGNKWIAEEKYDGDRIRARITNGKVSLFNRRGINVTERYPEFKATHLDKDMFLDGEMCVLDKNGLSKFNEGIAFRTHCTTSSSIMEASEAYPVTLIVFDVLELEGRDIRHLSWTDRRVILENLELGVPFKVSPYSENVLELWKSVTAKGGEGVILKKRDASYSEGKRSSSWRKVKDIKENDITVTKFTDNGKGIRVESDEGIAVQVSGYHAPPLRALLKTGKCKAKITITIVKSTKSQYLFLNLCLLVFLFCSGFVFSQDFTSGSNIQFPWYHELYKLLDFYQILLL